MDPICEIRGMCIVAMPYPPLPMQVYRVESDEDRVSDQATTITSHDVIAHCLNRVALQGQDDARTERQKQVETSLLARLRSAPDSALYDLYCAHSREHIEAYFPRGARPDVRFLPAETIAMGDRTHRAMCSFLAAKHILAENPSPATAEDLAGFPFHELLARLRAETLGGARRIEKGGISDARREKATLMDHTEAIACFAGGFCLQVCVGGLESIKLRYEERIPDHDFSTWMVEGAQLFTLLQTPEGTRLYDHQTDFLHYAGPDLQFPKGVLVDHAFLCQAVQDREGPPRLLVFDLVLPAIQNPMERHGALLRLQPQLPSCCHVQWAGETRSLRAFLASSELPHRVECIAALRGPLVVVKEGTGPPIDVEVLRISRQQGASLRGRRRRDDP